MTRNDVFNHSGPILMLNGRLEDSAVGIGSIARERRRGFISSWEYAYSLEPLQKGALMMSYPDEWQLFSADKDGYRFSSTFKDRPNSEQIDECLG